MALILVRGENYPKLFNAISDIEKHANLTLVNKPKVIDSNYADSAVEKILKAALRTRSDVATAFITKEDPTFCIMQIKKIHPPAHVVIISDEYDSYKEIMEMLETAEELVGFKSNKTQQKFGMKDYKSKSGSGKINQPTNSYL